MNPLAHQFAERSINLPLPFYPAQAGKGPAFDRQREMAFAARIVAGMADVLLTLVLKIQKCRRQCGRQPFDHLASDGSGGGVRHRPYIERFRERGRMQILVTKGEKADWIEARRKDRSVEREIVPHKGPVAHDLVHFAVERELRLERGFWGLVASGNAPQRIAEMAKMAGHASAKRAAMPDPDFVQAIQVERIVESFEAELWSGGSDNDSLRAMAQAGCEQSLVDCPELGHEALDRTRRRLRELAGQWAGLAVGETLTLDWPEPIRADA